jgi:cholest-4-en-3-one 26-monooxygenase
MDGNGQYCLRPGHKIPSATHGICPFCKEVVRAEIDGRHLSERELINYINLLLAAGNETTRSAIAHGLLAFAEHPDQWAALRSDPEGLLDTAVEEVIRWASPVNYMARTATRDVELHGRLISAGDKVVLLYSSANRDESVFENPDRFDVRRSPNHHLGFGFGPHFCLGATLARIELRAIFEVLIPRVQAFELAGPVVRARSSFLNAIKELPLRAV